VAVDVSGVGDLALGGTVDAVDLGGCEGLEAGQVKCIRECVDAGVLEELVTGLVDFWESRVALEIAGAGKFAWEIIASVQELEEASDGVEVFVDQINSALLISGQLEPLLVRSPNEQTYGYIVAELRTSIREPWTLGKQGLMGSQQGLLIALTNEKTNNGALEIVDVCDPGWDILHCFFLERHSVLIVCFGGSDLDLNRD